MAERRPDFALTDYRLQFERAIRQVARQADCSTAEATDLMMERSDTEGCSLGDLAIAIIEDRIRFEP